VQEQRQSTLDCRYLTGPIKHYVTIWKSECSSKTVCPDTILGTQICCVIDVINILVPKKLRNYRYSVPINPPPCTCALSGAVTYNIKIFVFVNNTRFITFNFFITLKWLAKNKKYCKLWNGMKNGLHFVGIKPTLDRNLPDHSGLIIGVKRT
jgi:hypothetical protein